MELRQREQGRRECKIERDWVRQGERKRVHTVKETHTEG